MIEGFARATRFATLIARLERWREVRPLIHIATCPYARALVLAMIDVCVHTTEVPEDRKQTVLQHLYRLLHDHPPHLDPPHSAGLLF
ncbi:MAG: hypothetical protein AAB388_03690 [Patescibacteria group bacterium]